MTEGLLLKKNGDRTFRKYIKNKEVIIYGNRNTGM